MGAVGDMILNVHGHASACGKVGNVPDGRHCVEALDTRVDGLVEDDEEKTCVVLAVVVAYDMEGVAYDGCVPYTVDFPSYEMAACTFDCRGNWEVSSVVVDCFACHVHLEHELGLAMNCS